jgi:hypothetical protein
MRDRFGIFGAVIRIRKLSLLLVMTLRMPNNPVRKHHLQHLTNTRRGLKKTVASLEYQRSSERRVMEADERRRSRLAREPRRPAPLSTNRPPVSQQGWKQVEDTDESKEKKRRGVAAYKGRRFHLWRARAELSPSDASLPWPPAAPPKSPNPPARAPQRATPQGNEP